MSKTIRKVKNLLLSQALVAVNVLRLAAATKDGETFTIGTRVYEIDTDPVAAITAGRVRVNLSGILSSAARATGTGTTSGNFSDTETVTLNGKVYTMQAALTNVDGHVLIGANAQASLDNLAAAVTLGAGVGVTYATATTAHPTVTAARATASTITITALAYGTSGNALTTTETGAAFSFGAGTLAGGVDPTADESATAIVAAINGDASGPVNAEKISANEVLIKVKAPGVVSLACTETLAGANNVWAAATTFGGAGQPGYVKGAFSVERVPTATEITLQTMHFVFPFAPTTAIAQIRTSAGALKAFDGSVIVSGKRVTVSGTGAVDPAANDKVVCVAFN